LHDTRLTPELAGKPIDRGDTLLSRIRVAQPVSGMTRIVLDTSPTQIFRQPRVESISFAG